jgi:outer membrane receptor for ferrienterochelin and colicins
MKSFFCISFFLFLFSGVFSQNHISFVVKDSVTAENLPGVLIRVAGTANATVTGPEGNAVLSRETKEAIAVEISLVGYFPKRISVLLSPDSTAVRTVLLVPQETGLDEVIVSTTRTNSRIEDLPTKVEVLGEEDMDEESTIAPGNVSSILGDLAIITVQRTNQVNGNDAIRMQGLDPKYTQIMRDGLPLFGGFSGSLGVLSIPPLDLKQVEIIKGSASTLYGGGAIGGLINFISKTPGDSAKTTFIINQSSLGESNANAFCSRKKNRLGFTLSAGMNLKQARDVNNDGFTEVPEDKNYMVHPRFFFDLNKRSRLVLGFTSIYDNRTGGDIKAVKLRQDTGHTFVQNENTLRNTADILFTQEFPKHFLTVKTAGSAYERKVDYSGFNFNGTQYSSYSEVNDMIKKKKHTIVAGLNVMTEAFVINKSDSINLKGYDYFTAGGFIQDDWQAFKKLAFQLGMRFDRHSVYGSFPLPRVSVFYRPGPKLSIRIAAGTGYKIPNVFDLAGPSASLTNVPVGIKPENSYGANADINYHTVIFSKVNVTLNQAFYYSAVNNPVVLSVDTLNRISSKNGAYTVNSYGSDTYLRFTYEDLQLYLGYNHTESLQQYSSETLNMPFNPKDKISATLSWEIEAKWRMGAEASYTANQYIYNNKGVSNFWFLAGMIEKKFKGGSVVLNCENILDFRQSRVETIVDGTYKNPVFKPVWGPIEGRVINLSVKVNL